MNGTLALYPVQIAGELHVFGALLNNDEKPWDWMTDESVAGQQFADRVRKYAGDRRVLVWIDIAIMMPYDASGRRYLLIPFEGKAIATEVVSEWMYINSLKHADVPQEIRRLSHHFYQHHYETLSTMNTLSHEHVVFLISE